LIVAAAAALAACTRSTPPAPVIYGSGQTQPPTQQQAMRTPPTQPTRPSPAPQVQQPSATDRVTAQQGDTVYTLSRQHGIPLRELIEANKLTPPYALKPGQQVILPRFERHKVRDGETVYGIARQYGIDARQLVQINNIPPPYKIAAGQNLKLPARLPSQIASTAPTMPAQVAAAPAAAPAPQPQGPTQRQESIFTPEPTPPAVAREPEELPDPEPDQPQSAGRIPDATPDRGGGFLWPVRGKVLSKFGPQGRGLHNDGINIAAPQGTPIRAAENGVVVYAGNELPGFGNLLILRHAGGWTTAYGHTDAFRVRRGDTVRRGQVIATVGRTGGVATPQLHFEIRKGSDAVDPSRYLAGSSTAAATPSGAARDGRPSPG
jgi:murein DD-endopeptidase MepM/ murein hydrolase activator NlpD